MPKYRITGPDGSTYEITAPEGASEADVLAFAKQNAQAAKEPEEPGKLASLGAGLGKGFGQVVLNAQKYAGKGLSAVGAESAGRWLQQDADTGLRNIAAELKPYKDANPTTAAVGEVGGNVVATLPVGGLIGKGLSAVGLNRLAQAAASGGFSTGAPVGNTLAAKAADMGIRMAGAGATGYVAGGLVDPESAGTAAAISAAIPPAAKLAGKAGEAVAAAVRPLTASGQEKIAASALREFATDPAAAIANLRQAREVVPGSAPTTVMAAGDEGLAGLSRSLQSADPRYAAELSARSSAQNAARTAAMEGIAGNTGKLALAREARDSATAAMRESVLDAAGSLPARPVLDSIDRLMKNPENAGKLSQQALADFRGRIAQWAPEGQIDARALYAIRKDINDVLEGKLQGEAGNLRHASGQLIKVKKAIDDAIDMASRRMPMSEGTAVIPAGANIERAGMQGAYGSQAPRSTWGDYLRTYSDMSVPINQMEKLDEVLRAFSTGTVDKQGNAILSAAKANNYLRNNAKELQKVLSPEQIDTLRRVAADLNAAQLAANSGRAVGSNTVQNLSGVNALSSLVGRTIGGSAPVQSTVGRAVNFLYKPADQQVMNKLAQALLDPQEASRMLATPEGNRLLEALSRDAAKVGYRTAPVLAAQ